MGGDTVSGIAARHGLSTAAVLAANGLNNSSIIYPGQKLKLAGATAVTGKGRRHGRGQARRGEGEPARGATPS